MIFTNLINLYQFLLLKDYFNGVIPNLKKNGFDNIYDCSELLKNNHIVEKYDCPLYPLNLKRRIDKLLRICLAKKKSLICKGKFEFEIYRYTN